jgi:hypothetical protein
MKECEWCGTDFRGPYKELDNHFFCSDTCEADWRLDVRGEVAGEEESAPVDKNDGDTNAKAEEIADGDEK